MVDLKPIEERVRHLLATEKSAIRLSNTLFSPPDGLFCQIGTTVEERKEIVQSALFLEAQRQLSELMRQEGAAFASVVEELESRLPGTGYRFTLEQVQGT